MADAIVRKMGGGPAGAPLNSIAITIMILVILVMVTGCGHRSPATPPPTLSVKVGTQRYQLELVLDEAARSKGLSQRSHIDANGGMLFVFTDVRLRRFWMRDCFVAIDVLFIDPGGRIIALHAMQPQLNTPLDQLKTYSSHWPAQYAIELAGGTIERLGLKRYDRIDLPVEDLKRWVR